MAATLISVAAEQAIAQRPSTVRVSADNDAFNFWLPPWERTDQEYTSGVQGTVGYEGRSRLLRRFMPSVGATCGASAPCARHSFTLGQAIFTGPAGSAASQSGMASGAGTGVARRTRPNAGWLYLEASDRDSAGAIVTELSVAVGVVGPPALGETMQRFFHSMGAEFQRPVDWSRQLPFEPGFVARYTRTVYAYPWVDNDTWRAVPFTSLGAAVGTIRTEGVAGAGIRTDATLPGYASRWYVPLVEVSFDMHARGVIRDEFLDGAFFRSSERVPRRPFVLEQRFGIGLRWQQLSLGYRVIHAGRLYDAQPEDARWGALAAEWRFNR